jgi:hypothetical protein
MLQETSLLTETEEHEGLTDFDNFEHVVAVRVLEDFVVTSLLRTGRALKNSELSGAAEGFTLTRAALREGLQYTERVVSRGRDWELALRSYWASKPRDERSRRPLERTVEELMTTIGKPLPLPVIAREVSHMRGVLPEAVREACANILKTSRMAVEVANGGYLHRSFLLDAGAPTEELIIAENALEDDNDFVDFVYEEFPKNSNDLYTRVIDILNAVERPLQQKTLGFFLWRQDPQNFNERDLALLLGDRSKFYPFVGGGIAAQTQMPQLRATLTSYATEIGTATGENLDGAALLRQRIAPADVIAPRPEDLDEVRKAARNSGQPITAVSALVDILEMEPDDERFVPTLHGLNDALRKSGEYMPAGIGRFILRESIPSEVTVLPDILRPVHLSIRNNETHEPFDMELSDDGLEGDCAEFIHAPEWEDVSEEVEVRLSRNAQSETELRYVVTYPHFKTGTLKLRRQDEAFFGIDGPLTRISIRAFDGESATNLAAWASRESGLIYGLGDWMKAHLPQSGGVLEFVRNGNEFALQAGAPDKETFIDAERIAQLEALQERSAYLSLFDLLQSVMTEHENGAELSTLWAEVNVVRRSSKRLMCSILSGYNCFFYKQRGPEQLFWRFEASRVEQGFKRNKRKFVRK